MAYKPGDFFIGIIDFFAVLVPGLILLMLQGKWAVYIYPLQDPITNSAYLFTFLVAAYVVGHFVFALGALLVNKFHDFVRPDLETERKGELIEINLLSEHVGKLPSKERNNIYHRAFSIVRLKGGDALAEIERNAANYKLFRSLVIVFFIDAILSHVFDDWTAQRFLRLPGTRVLISMGLAIGAYLRFAYLRKWTEGLAIEFANLISNTGDSQADKKIDSNSDNKRDNKEDDKSDN